MYLNLLIKRKKRKKFVIWNFFKENKQSTFEDNEKTKQKIYNLIVFRYIETKYGVIHSRSEVNQITKHEVNTQKDEKLNLI